MKMRPIIALFVAAVLLPAVSWSAECCAAPEKKPACTGNSCPMQTKDTASCPMQGGASCPMKQSGCSHLGGHHGCCMASTQFADPANVHWANKGVSFGNYMKLAKAEIPAIACQVIPTFGPIFFDFDKSHLRPESVEACRQLAAFMKANPNFDLLIEGNCCDIGTDEYNMALGQRRADTARKFLIENGIPADRIVGKSNGESKQKYGKDQRPLNRRDDFMLNVHFVQK